MFLDKQHPRPVYLQLKEMLQNQIEQGIYLSHQQLPSERDLCQHYELSRMTARRALQELIAEGFAYTRAGKGTFVSDKLHLAGRQFERRWPQAEDAGLGKAALEARHGQELSCPLESFDCVGSERAIREALATQSLETVACGLFLETIRNFEQRWLKGEVSLLIHNYAITTLHSYLVAMVNAAAMPETGPKVLLGCVPGDQHDIGLLLLALMLRRRGYRVVYLGSNMAAEEFYHSIELAQPKLICIAAATEQAAQGLTKLSQIYENDRQRSRGATSSRDTHRPRFAFGGSIFSRNPRLASTVSGFFLGATIEDAVSTVQNLVVK